MEQVWSQAVAELTSLGIRLVYTALIIVIGIYGTKLLYKIVKKSHAFSRLELSAQSFILSVLKAAMYIIVGVSAAISLGIPAATFVALLGAGGVAIGLALQGSLSNFAGGLMLVIFKPFKVGDFIESGGSSGTVESITIFYTTLTTADNRRVTLPNGNLSNAVVVNSSAKDTRRIDLSISIAYSSGVDAARTALLETAAADNGVLSEPAPTVSLVSFDDSAVVVQLRCYCRTGDYLETLYRLNEQAKLSLEKHGVEMPFPQLDVHINQK